MSDVTIVCVKCGKEKIFEEFQQASDQGWTLGIREYCKRCKPDRPIPRVPHQPAIWYKFYWYLSLLRGNRDDNYKLDSIRRADEYFMTFWKRKERSETWVRDTMVHWHCFPKDFSWEKYENDRDTWLKYNASIEQRALNYHFIVWTFKDYRHLFREYWTEQCLEVY